MSLHTPTATCHTPGCENAGIPIEAPWDDLGEGLPTPSVTCGACGNPIEDVTE
jgi:hypothetical protein